MTEDGKSANSGWGVVPQKDKSGSLGRSEISTFFMSAYTDVLLASAKTPLLLFVCSTIIYIKYDCKMQYVLITFIFGSYLRNGAVPMRSTDARIKSGKYIRGQKQNKGR